MNFVSNTWTLSMLQQRMLKLRKRTRNNEVRVEVLRDANTRWFKDVVANI